MANWASGSPQTVAGDENERFAQAEREADWLRQERAAGRISEEQFKARLHDLMIQDGGGEWWAVGQQSGEWYRNEGGQWVRARPAGTGSPAAAPARPAPMYPAGRGQPHRAAALMVSALCLLVVPLLAYSCGKGLFSSSYDPELTATLSTLLFLLAGIVGAVITFRVAGRWWRGE